ncbi:MAG: DUF3826 domain-containing protein [Pedosphaera sp.]|nr:DUF3826 domain-containing protein [Pedosphaera sp.]
MAMSNSPRSLESGVASDLPPQSKNTASTRSPAPAFNRTPSATNRRHASDIEHTMRRPFLSPTLLSALLALNAATFSAPATADSNTAEAKAKSDADAEKKAAEWVGSLKLGDAAKETRVTEVIATHLKTIRDWHNEHPFTTVPAGINPVTGNPLSQLDRQMIANSALPKTVHENLMTGLRKDRTPEQVEAVLDKFTVGKVAFTLKGYHAIVPDLTAGEEKTILGFLQQAREQAVDYKNMNQISAIFEIYKTKSEQSLNANGRDWKKLYQAYTDAIKAKKAADANAPTPKQ